MFAIVVLISLLRAGVGWGKRVLLVRVGGTQWSSGIVWAPAGEIDRAGKRTQIE